MQIVDRGGGTPVVVIPGVQGRWEWMSPAIDALAQRCRVITFSLADEPTVGAAFDPLHGFSCYVDQVRQALDAAGLRRAAICGVSYGGLIAAAFAARHPDRTASLVLVSALPPSWSPDRRVQFFLRAPRLLTPLFLLSSLRMYCEIAAATDGTGRAVPVAVRHGCRALAHMFSPARMARRVRLVASEHLADELAHVRVPTLVVTGEPHLDRVVPVQATLDYARLWPGTQVERIERTGHLGLITRPDRFAALVVPFAEGADRDTLERRRPPCGSLSESGPNSDTHGGPGRAERAKRYRQPAKGSVGISRETLVG